MNIARKMIVIMLMTLAALGVTGVARAQEPQPSQPAPLRGEVTAVSNSGFSLDTVAGETVTVIVTADTRIRLAETRSDGSLSDIQAGNFAGVRGQRNDDGSVTARGVLVLAQDPRDLDRMRGRVTAIEGDTLLLENREGEQLRVVTDENTRVRIGGKPGSLEEINLDDPLLALGNLQGDGALQAKVVALITPEQVQRHTLRGEVLSVDIAAGELTVAAAGQKEGNWTVTTTAQTKYRNPDVENPSLADIEAGDRVLIVGRPTGEKSGAAWFIAVVPPR